MDESLPSSREWQELYRAAGEFFQLRPWEWMDDSQLFGVLNPETEEIGYCCVMGALGELLALGVYLGAEGLDGYLAMRSGETGAGDDALLYHQLCLMASFEDRKSIEAADLKVIKSLGLKFRGRQSWPLFRSYRPGFVPWHVTGEEARFLTVALRQAVDVGRRVRDNEQLLEPPEDEVYLVRVPERREEQTAWVDRWMPPAPLKARAPVAIPAVDEQRLQEIKKTCVASPATWEIDCSHAPFPIGGEGRPYFPLLLLCVDRDTGLVLGFHLTKPETYLRELQDKVQGFFEDGGRLPQHIHVIEEELFDALLPIANVLGIRLRLVEELDCVDDVREGLTGSVGRGF